jgi:hypothetical protein
MVTDQQWVTGPATSDEGQGKETLGQALEAPRTTDSPPLDSGDGQAALSPDSGQATDGQAPDTTGAPDAPESREEPTFYPEDLPDDPAIQAAYSQMRGAWTRAMQSVSKDRQKIEAFDAFERSPVETLRQLVTQYGYALVPSPGAGDPPYQGNLQAAPQGQPDEEWQPQSWQELLDRAEKQAEQRVLQRLNPILSRVQQQQAQSVEHQLDEIDPLWRTYEPEMRKNLERAPHLGDDISLLYEVSVPMEVRKARYTKEAVQRLQKQANAAQPEGKSQKSRSQPAPKAAGSFSEAVQQAREEGRRAGWYR